MPENSPVSTFFSSRPSSQVMPPSNSLEEPHPPAAIPPAKALRIIIPPTEYCPFSTDLTLPFTPHSLPTPVSSSCFTFSDTQELATTGTLPPMPVPASSSCSPDTPLADFASPTSSQFLLMPHARDVVGASEAAICVAFPATSAATDEFVRNRFNGTKSRHLRPLEVSCSTWLSDLGGYTDTDRIFRHNLLEIASFETESSPASTPALSQSAISPSSQVSSLLACGLPPSLTRSMPLSPYSPTMSPQSSSLPRLVLKPTGTDAFPSTLDSLEAWREGVAPGILASEEPLSPLSMDTHDSRFGGFGADTPMNSSLPSRHPQSHHLSPYVPCISRSQTFIKHAKKFGRRVKQLVSRQSACKQRRSMDRGVAFRVITSQDSENGSVILITAPPLPYDEGSLTLVPGGGTMGEEQVRSPTTSACSSAVQASAVELANSGTTELGSGQDSSNRNTLHRLSLAALSTLKRF